MLVMRNQVIECGRLVALQRLDRHAMEYFEDFATRPFTGAPSVRRRVSWSGSPRLLYHLDMRTAEGRY
jgi:hypothetical protein